MRRDIDNSTSKMRCITGEWRRHCTTRMIRNQILFGGNVHVGIHFASSSVRFQSGTTSTHIAFSIYLCMFRAQVSSAAAAAARRGRSAAQGGILTTWLIRPLRAPPAGRDGRAVLAPGFLVPAPHGHSLRTGLRVVPLPVALRPAPTSHSVRAPLLATTRHIIHANLRPLIFLPSDPPAVKPGACNASAECSWTSHRCTFPSESERRKPVQSGRRRRSSDEICGRG